MPDPTPTDPSPADDTTKRWFGRSSFWAALTVMSGLAYKGLHNGWGSIPEIDWTTAIGTWGVFFAFLSLSPSKK